MPDESKIKLGESAASPEHIDAQADDADGAGYDPSNLRWWCPTEQRWTWCPGPCPDGSAHEQERATLRQVIADAIHEGRCGLAPHNRNIACKTANDADRDAANAVPAVYKWLADGLGIDLLEFRG